MSFRIILSIVLSLLLFSSSALAFQGYVQSVGEGGTIAWGNGDIAVVRAVAKSNNETTPYSPLAVRKAVSKARRLLLDMVINTRINAKQTVSAAIADDRELFAQIRGLIHNSLFQGPSQFDEEGAVQVSEKFRGQLAELILPTTIQFQSGIAPKLSTYMAQEETELEVVGSIVTGYTGVIIDARGLKITPALAPVIYGREGLGAYGAFLVSRSNAVNKGVVAYADTADLAVLKERVGNNPLRVKAVSAYGSWRTDLIVETDMGRLVRAIMKYGDIVKNCRVVIVMDKAVPVETETKQ